MNNLEALVPPALERRIGSDEYQRPPRHGATALHGPGDGNLNAVDLFSGPRTAKLESLPFMIDHIRRSGCNSSLWLFILMLAFSLPQERAFAVGNDKAPARKEEITTIVIHAIGGPMCKGNKVVFTAAPGDSKRWKKWFEKQKSISIHYIVDRDGNVEKIINEEKVAWHASGHNKNSIGIELVNRGDGVEEYPEKQVSSLISLVNKIISRHQGIRKEKVVRHSDIDNRKFECGGQKIDKKQDPGPKFPYDDFISKLVPDRKLINHARSRNGGGIEPSLFH